MLDDLLYLSLDDQRKKRISELSVQLLKHYDKTARIFPWRVSPQAAAQGEKPDPYKVWISEIMLQQTRVTTVKEYYEKFITRFPTIRALALAEEDEVLKLWAGLGYYSRARNLHACAKAVAEKHNGFFPATEKELLALPGVGSYTAGAILTIAFQQQAAPADGNIERVFSRLFVIPTAGDALKKTVRSAVAAHIPVERPGDFIQALMDLGSEICTPKKPKCLICPIGALCEARLRGVAEDFPKKKLAKMTQIRTGIMTIIENSAGAVYLRKRENKGLLGGMYEFPFTYSPLDPENIAPLPKTNAEILGEVKHIFTHFTLYLSVRYYRDDAHEIESTGGFFDPADKKNFPPLPKLMRKALHLYENFLRSDRQSLKSMTFTM